MPVETVAERMTSVLFINLHNAFCNCVGVTRCCFIRTNVWHGGVYSFLGSNLTVS
jgi:hypothetical protein